ncbi:MAG: glycoside hydrolase/phage tail family protein [Alphaproteobacteria bacterium]
MATLALSVVGAAAGNALFPAGFSFLGASLTGAAIGRAIGGVAGSYIDNALFGASGQNTVRQGPRLSDLTVTASTEGADIPRAYGRARLGGQVIWATNFEEEVTTSSSGGSGKGMGGGGGASTKTYNYYANFAVGLCEGEITRIGRVWADGEEINLTDFTWRLYLGTETQNPDSLIEAKEGADNAPAYRGLAYIVFERMPLKSFGNRIPQLNFEVFRAVDGFETSVQGVTMIPAAGEFVYSPTEVRVDGGAGTTYSENRHTTLGATDFTVSLDQLEETLPSCAAVSLFVTWFGDDLRCGNCSIEPRVETDDKGDGTTPVEWGVAGLTRSTANKVSEHDGKPAFGGTPSDSTVIDAIKEMRSTRGLEVIFTPFLLMDIANGNTLTDPYTGAAYQPSYPWRGRITCNPAPGETGSPDQTASAQTQVDAFYGTVTASDFSVAGETVIYTGPTEWTYSRFILHCAALCKAAGGVEAFVIGSEMRGLGWVRDSSSTYPFVDYLKTLAAQVKTLLPSADVTYAADWSEYFGHQPTDGSGDVYFHLDTLWSDSNIDAVAIDNYWPLTDWRDGTDHLDYVAGYRSIYDPDYLAGNIEGGEGYDWYYASAADRDSQTRTTITDGYGKPWVFRYKALKDWWQNAHYNRPGGVESGSPTSWTAESKPVWFTELGCPAVDRGANQPNVFYDPKSSESFLPYYSKGIRDDLMQREYLRAFLEWYAVTANNPVSSVYADHMVDTSRIMLYTWDARPYPAFPAFTSIWADYANWQRGHWLPGRMAAAPVSLTVAKILDDAGFSDYDVSQLSGSMAGYVIDGISSARDALQPLETAFFFDSYEAQGEVRFAHRGRAGSAASLTPDDLVESSADAALYELRRGQETDLPRAAKVTYIDSDRDYAQKVAEGRRIAGASGRVSQARLPIVTSYDLARTMAETMVQEAWAARERVTFALPPSQLALDASDMVTFTAGGRSWPLRLTSATLGADGIAAEALSIERALYEPFAAPVRMQTAVEPVIYGAADVAFMDLPLIRGDEVAYVGNVAAIASPWPGGVAVYRSPTTSGYELKALVDTPAVMGTTQTDFYSGPTSRWDNGNTLRVTLAGGELTSADEVLVLGGSNLAAVQNASGDWEVIQFTTATLVGTLTYDLTGLLRGQYGTEAAMADPVAAGARFVLLDTSITQVDMTADDVGLAFNWKYGPSPYDIGNSAYASKLAYSFDGVGLRPLSPCHVRGVFNGGGDLFIAWLRRTRQGGDGWAQTEVPLGEDSEAYEVDIMNGASVMRTIASSTPAITYTAAQQTSDFGAPQSSYTVRVYQISASYGRGQYRAATVP